MTVAQAISEFQATVERLVGQGATLPQIREATREVVGAVRDDDLLTCADLAMRWHVDERTAARMCRKHHLRPVAFGHRTLRFRPADIQAAEVRMTMVTTKKGKAK